MNDNPLLLIGLVAGAAYLLHLWYSDLKEWRAGKPNPKGFPGATDWSRASLLIPILGVLALVALETVGEILLGIADEQSEMKLSLVAYSVLAAPVIEELLMRGFLFFDKGSRARFWAASIACSLVFALAHAHLWDYRDAEWLAANTIPEGTPQLPLGDAVLVFSLGIKGWFSTAFLFAFSLWMYFVRIAAFNENRSLAVPVIAHAVKNLAVVLVKAVQGFVVWG